MSFDVGPGGVVALEADGVVLVSGELELLDGDAVGDVVEPDDDDEGGVDGVVSLELDELERGDVDGFIVEDDEDEPDGDGATTGGVVDDVVGVSRWQPASPSAKPVQSSVTKVLRIIISRSG